MKIIISEEVKNAWKFIKIGYISYNITGVLDNEYIYFLLKQKCNDYKNKESALENESIITTRNAIKSFGKTPSKYRGSAESLLRRVIKYSEIPSINPIVDINNIISIKYLTPVGSYNTEEIHGDIFVTIGYPCDNYQSINRSTICLDKMLVLRDDKGPFGSIHADSKRTMVSDYNKNILTVIFSFSENSQIIDNSFNYLDGILRKMPIAIIENGII